jgi:hypothetical protein
MDGEIFGKTIYMDFDRDFRITQTPDGKEAILPLLTLRTPPRAPDHVVLGVAKVAPDEINGQFVHLDAAGHITPSFDSTTDDELLNYAELCAKGFISRQSVMRHLDVPPPSDCNQFVMDGGSRFSCTPDSLVKVRLTEAGRNQMMDHFVRINKEHREHRRTVEDRPPEISEDGWVEGTLGTVMSYFEWKPGEPPFTEMVSG